MINENIVNNSPFIVFGPSTTTGSATNDNTFQRNISKCLFGVLASGGSGGSSGWSDVAGATTTPGGGGGSGNGGIFFSPTYLLPSLINVSVGAGGAGGAGARLASNPGYSGTLTAIYVSNKNTNLWSTGSPSGATAATTSAAGTGGSIGTFFNSNVYNPGICVNINATAGTNGSTTSSASNIGVTASFLSGGAGGGGITNTNIAAAGGSISASGLDLATSGTAGPTVALTAPCKLFNPHIQNSSKGGCGGGSSSAAAGSDGAPGGFGSGGGGGGGSNSAASNGGSGGAGGPGFAILVEI